MHRTEKWPSAVVYISAQKAFLAHLVKACLTMQHQFDLAGFFGGNRLTNVPKDAERGMIKWGSWKLCVFLAMLPVFFLFRLLYFFFSQWPNTHFNEPACTSDSEAESSWLQTLLQMQLAQSILFVILQAIDYVILVVDGTRKGVYIGLGQTARKNVPDPSQTGFLIPPC